MKKEKNDSGITLIALVVTIIVLLILAGVTINLALNNNGIISRAKDASETYAKAEQNEARQLSQIEDEIDELAGITALAAEKIETITNKIKTAETLQELEVAYEAKEIQDETSQEGKGRSVTVESEYSGNETDQIFYQSEIGAIGTNKLKWYILSADENGVNLVSQSTQKRIKFYDSPGYDNCLYFLNEISKKLFINEEYGITESRIHALTLTDIKQAAELTNKGLMIDENGTVRDWNWNTDVMSQLITGNGTTLGGAKTYTNTSFTYHPAIYSIKEGTTEVEENNPMYDEKMDKKITDNGMRRTEIGNPASKLTVNNTYSSDNSIDSWKSKLANFGNSQIATELFKSDESFWLASRCISTYTNSADFRLRIIDSGYLYSYNLCDSNGNSGYRYASYPFRVVVSVSSKNVNIASDGTVTLIANNS